MMSHFMYRFESFIKTRISRQSFLKGAAAGLALFLSQNALLKKVFAAETPSKGRKSRGSKGVCDIAVSSGKGPRENTLKAIEGLGGMGRFVKKGDTVLVKPNMAWDRTPEQAANTNPEVVSAIVKLCFAAGAKRVNVFDVPCNEESRVHETTGIAAAARQAGANVYFADHWNVVKADLGRPSALDGWPILKDAVDCDVFINVPVLKHHGLTGLTLSMKNLMGVCSGRRGLIHLNIAEKLADLTEFIKPDLTVIDATRVLMRNGPTGGNLEDVQTVDKVLAGTDPVLADAYACTLVNREPRSISYIACAADRNLGSADVARARILTV